MKGFEPKIIAFCCNWCSYAGADLAGISRIQYPPTVRIVRTMCSGRVDPIIVLETFKQGADGILVLGCHPGDCHYLEGNYQAERKIKMTKMLLAQTGLGDERLGLEWVSAAEGLRFAEIIQGFTAQVKSLGPSPLAGDSPDMDVLHEVEAAKTALADFRLRVLVGKERKLVEKGNIYGERISQGRFDELVGEAISGEYIRRKILLLIKQEPLSAKQIAAKMGIPANRILRDIATLRRKGMLTLERIEGMSPLYTALEVGR